MFILNFEKGIWIKIICIWFECVYGDVCEEECCDNGKLYLIYMCYCFVCFLDL